MKSLRFSGLLLFCAILVVPANSVADRPSSERETLIRSVVDLTNNERAKLGLPPLTYDKRLEKAAQWMAEDMANKGYFSHTDSFGRSVGQRVPTFGYENYAILRENLAGGFSSPKEAVDAWMKSPGHKASILCEKCTNIGVGIHYDPKSKYGYYWVQEFGTEMR